MRVSRFVGKWKDWTTSPSSTTHLSRIELGSLLHALLSAVSRAFTSYGISLSRCLSRFNITGLRLGA